MEQIRRTLISEDSTEQFKNRYFQKNRTGILYDQLYERIGGVINANVT